MSMSVEQQLFNAGTGAIILVLVLLANYYQFKVRRRFSGVIGKIMFWYSAGLASLLGVTIFNWIMFSYGMDIATVSLAGRVFDIAAIACFLKGAMVIR